MPYMVLGAGGGMAVDPYTQAAGSIFSGLGRSRLIRRVRRVARVTKRLQPHRLLMRVAPHRLLKRMVAPGRKRRQYGGVAEGAETAVVAPEGPIPEVSTPGTSIPEESPPEPPPLEERRGALQPAPVEERYSAPPEAAAVPETEPAPPPPLEQRYGGYTIEPGSEPWARTPQPPPPEAEEAPPPPAPHATEPEQTVEYQEGPVPEQSIEGNCCGGFILTGPSPAQHGWQYKRAWAAALKTPPYRGLGQADPFWYRPEWEFERPVPHSGSPSAGYTLHKGSKWGQFDVTALQAARRAADPFTTQGRKLRRRTRREASGLPF